MFSSARVGRELPPRPDPASSFRYSFLVRLGASFGCPFAVFAIVALIEQEAKPTLFLFSAFLIGSMFLASLVCEACLAGITARFIEPHGVPEYLRRRFWGTLCQVFSTHLMANAAVFFFSYAYRCCS